MPKTAKKDATAEAILALADAVKSIEERLGKLEKIEKPETQKLEIPENATVSTPINTTPFPREWRDVIDTVLNAKFLAEVNYRDSANFELIIFVPKEYSNAKPAEWEMYKADRRVKIMPNYLGAEGIRQYCELIAENLGQETRYKINNDRAQLTK